MQINVDLDFIPPVNYIAVGAGVIQWATMRNESTITC